MDEHQVNSAEQDYIFERLDKATYEFCKSCGLVDGAISECIKRSEIYGELDAEELSQNLRDAAYNYQTDEVKKYLEIEATSKGEKILCTVDNFLSILLHDNRFADIEYNSLSGNPELKRDGKNTPLLRKDIADAKRYIEQRYKLYNAPKFEDAFTIFTCEHRAYNPIIRAIESTEWDGISRVETFFIRWMKTEDTPYTRECSRLLFASGINRAYKHGSKVDNVIVFIGKQGCGKSQMCQWLAMDEALYASAHDDISGKTGAEMCEGKWLTELAELISTSSEDKLDEVKDFINRQVEHYRKPYEKSVGDYPRTNFFVGTTNRQTFLIDKTGNRRWWPLRVYCEADELFSNEDILKADIQQCWAEMAQAYKEHTPFADAYEHKDVLAMAEAERLKVMNIDDTEAKILLYLREHQEVCKVCIDMLWCEVLYAGNLYPPKRTKAESNRIGSILSDTCKWIGGTPDKVGKYSGKTWTRPAHDEVTCITP